MGRAYPGFTDLVIQVLGADPRPAYVRGGGGKTEFGLRLYDINLKWTVRDKTVIVHTVEADADAAGETG